MGLSEGHPKMITDQGKVLGGNVAEFGLDVLEEVNQMLRVTGIEFYQAVEKPL